MFFLNRVINCAFRFLHNANKATTFSQSPEKWVQGRRYYREKAWLSTLRNDGTQQLRLMELRWLLISAAVLINYLPTTKMFLYLGKVLIYLILFASRCRWMTFHFTFCWRSKERRPESLTWLAFPALTGCDVRRFGVWQQEQEFKPSNHRCENVFILGEWLH